jgi:hypothetical protein
MKHLTTQQHYDVPGGTLRVVLETDHALSALEREDLDQIANACAAFQAHEKSGHADAVAAIAPARDVDEAIWELGGEQAISAG